MKILADVDTGIDDAIALSWLTTRDEINLLAVTTTAGNTTAENAAKNSLAVLQICGSTDIPVAIGSTKPLVKPLITTPETHGDNGLGYAILPEIKNVPITDWWDLWQKIIYTNIGEVTLLITGPLTNLAYALRKEPKLPRLLKSIVIMGGCFNYPGNTTPTAEWNSWVDPDAAAEVYKTFEGLPENQLPIICSLGVTEQVFITPEQLATIIDIRADATTKFIADALQFYFDFHQQWGYGRIAHLHDLLAAEIATNKLSFQTETGWVGVETDSELTRGTTQWDCRNLLNKSANARIVTKIEPTKAIDLFINDLTKNFYNN